MRYNPDTPLTDLETIALRPNPSRTLYLEYVQRKYVYSDASYLIWAKELDIDTETCREAWPWHMLKARTITNAAKLRYLQYRILNRILTTNTKIAYWDKSISSNYTFCFEKSETLLHVLFHCKKVKQMWVSLEKWLKHFQNISVEFNPSLIILNNYEGMNNQFVNMVIIVMKQYIYSTKCKEQTLKFVDFMYTLNHWYQMERIESLASNKMKTFKRKWTLYEKQL